MRSNLKPYPENIYTSAQHLEALAVALATADLFNEITGALDKDLWFIEAHLQ